MAKREKPCFNIITEASVGGMANCCGTTEVGNFRERADVMNIRQHWNWETRSYATIPAEPATKEQALEHIFGRGGRGFAIATTIPNQKDAVQALKAVGFKKLCTTRSYEGNYPITVWQLRKTRQRSTR